MSRRSSANAPTATDESNVTSSVIPKRFILQL
jgi:hypothetical protein